MKGLFLVCLLATVLDGLAQKEIRSKLTNANVYFGYGAELAHTATATLQQGTQELVISQISNDIDINTIQVAVPENLVLLSYRFNTRTEVLPQQNPAIKRIEDSLKIMRRWLSDVAHESTVTTDLMDRTSRLIESYSSGQAKNLGTVELIKLLDFYTGKIQAYRDKLRNTQIRKDELEDQAREMQGRLNAIRQEHGGKQSKMVGEMILQLMAQQATTGEIGITYFTKRAGWIPTYDMRVKSIDNSFKLAYKASVNQTTGLDWKQVKLTLSTSNPNQGNKYPTLNPLLLQLYNPQMYGELKNKRNAYDYNRAQSLDEVVVTVNGTARKPAPAPVQPPADVSDFLTLNESQLNASFEIDLPYDIPSDGKTYSVTIKEEAVKASYKHYSVPRLDKDAFLLAEVNEWEQLDLLPGDANIIMDNVYLGKSFIDPNTTMDTLNVSLGRDKRVAVKRALVKEFCKTKVRGDSRTETFMFEITVKNNKKQDVSMLLKDQFPISRMKEVVVKLDEISGAEVNEELGTLNWKLDLKPGEIKKYRFSYSVTYPKEQKIANLR